MTQEHIERLNRHIAEGTLIRGAWRGTDEGGRETACLLAAMVPQCGVEETASACPAEVMPAWLACLTPMLDDNGSSEAWWAMVQRFASLASRWHRLDAAAWQRVQYTFLATVVREAASHTKEPAVTTVCERVAALCDGVVTTGLIDAASFEKERVLAGTAGTALAGTALAATAAAAAAAAAARAATAWAAAADTSAAALAVLAAGASAAAWDHIAAVLFDAIEKELSGATNQ